MRAAVAGALDGDSLDIIERNSIACAVVKLCGAGGFVRGDSLGCLQGAAILQEGRYAGRSERVAV